ncbi:MAG: pantoate--beta-alanine ligase [Rhodobacterales bacterium]|nr:MAG: pantoate--beta-alanine ligase [Rhodobacterales bacterium]
MKICRTIPEFRAALSGLRGEGKTLGLVPTMGALHDGHMALVEAAKAECDAVAATIFVNPTQFGDPADLETYPRTEAEDLALLKARGVAAVLIPEVGDIYPEGDETIVETTRLANMLHGEVRPGHYRGVCTVVTKLFNIAQPDAAFFGEKDYQQLQVIRRMARDLHMPIAIHGVPTQREDDGLARSSRNRRLTPEDRAAAPVLSRALAAAEEAVASGTTVEDLRTLIANTITAEPRATMRAIDIVAPGTLAPVEGPVKAPIAIMLSAEFGGILLIDQREIGVTH